MFTKKQLVEEVFDKAKRESGKSTKNGLSEYLVITLEEKVSLSISERTLIRYYDTYVINSTKKNEIEIDSNTLDKLSQYLSYRCFEHFVNPNEFVLDGVEAANVHRPIGVYQDLTKVVEGGLHINIHNMIRLPDFIKNNKGMSLGITGALLASGSFAHFNGSFQKNDHMYWNGVEYKLTTAQDRNPKHAVIPLDTVQFKYFKKITRPDTLDLDNGLNKVWYSKYRNKVEFFTMDGTNPDNHKELKPVSEGILEKYAGKKTTEK
ncbi:hypothetical protein [Chryseobacterium sp. MDT2-18]|uniref:hypothetical protein n=1 Tax=Chryseobacterium sp. MDT2-18 TaxID=1259136 RepID=UPI0027833971|nr:hypothetical protein [Chryseobacterium sp. MDT2-18]MDQ0477118.1 hypothetical protein [Chryseobacterium sp. MDT2-18]